MTTHTLKVSATYDDGATKYTRSESHTETAGSYTFVSEVIPDSSTDLEVIFACDKSQMKLFMMTADGTILVETNSGSTPDDTFSLTDSNHVIWADGQNGGEDLNPVSADIATNIFVTNASGSPVTLQIHLLEDPTV